MSGYRALLIKRCSVAEPSRPDAMVTEHELESCADDGGPAGRRHARDPHRQIVRDSQVCVSPKRVRRLEPAGRTMSRSTKR